MRINSSPFLLPLLTLMLSACAPKQTQLATEPANSSSKRVAVTLQRQTLTPDLYASAPEVVRYDRYRLVDISPTEAQRYPLAQLISLHIPTTLAPTVGDAVQYVLRESGYRLCTPRGQANALYRLPLPAVQNQLGPIRLSDALQMLGGPAWQVNVDEAQRVVCHSLRPGYRLPSLASEASSINKKSISAAPTSAKTVSQLARPTQIVPVQTKQSSKPVRRGGWLK
ncbi:PilL N-terminal domain-containing protein [Providencia rettgeri]